ncbi:sterol desaturase family protein [Herbaspirillum sp. RTI4]|uniref:sterol desaturase family protein n=1 Tax=Herbaspirillum sp. RTI4 TaxID=3048640 RepID=UPI002AB56841|nr:sterol desaturase family protein [Herbaspirillum sp. RTI4]MDY7577769.1 sterol desaturase family protein [Herbaspirillum sp. RTI4]MEA9980803.1 sterol desaturase family protein [Herbaspirillum sp. RTI4]
MEKIIVYVIPVFFVLIGMELAYGYFSRKNTYRLNDAISSLNQGLISQLVTLVTQFFQIGLYALVYRFVSIFPHATFWGTTAGWILAVLLFDFCDYWLHRMGHVNALMWAAHAVHHQSQDFNFSTALRQESTVVFIGWIFYLPMALLGVPPEQFAIAGLIVLVYQFWIHTEHVGKLGWFDKVFSSPSNHRVHHAVNDHYLDKNYGGMLIIWDRMFGTFMEEKEPCVYGTRTPLQSWDPVWAVVSGYWQLAQSASRLPRWQDKLLIWFKAPGWSPASLPYEGSTFDLDAARRQFDSDLSRSAIALTVLQFSFLLTATAALLWVADDLPYLHLLTTCAALLAGFWALGAFMQGRLSVSVVFAIDLVAGVVAAYTLR